MKTKTLHDMKTLQYSHTFLYISNINRHTACMGPLWHDRSGRSRTAITLNLKTLCHLPWCIAGRQLNRGPQNSHFYTNAWFERKSASIVLFTVRFRSCSSVFELYSFSSSPSAIFWEYSYDELRFRWYLWSNAAAKTERKIGEGLVTKICLLCVEKQEGPRRIRQQHEQWFCRVSSSPWKLRYESA